MEDFECRDARCTIDIGVRSAHRAPTLFLRSLEGEMSSRCEPEGYGLCNALILPEDLESLMPILPAEPQLYPRDLWQDDVGGIDPGRPWWCLHTKTRQEKATARYLFGRELTYYLPQVIQESRTPGGRVIRSLQPLFSGYVFFQGDDWQRIEALKSDKLNRVLEVADQEGLVRDLRQIHRLLSSGLEVLPEQTYPVGSRVRILSGPLQGVVGTVFRRDRRDQFVAVVRFLGRGATVELRDWQVERIEG